MPHVRQQRVDDAMMITRHVRSAVVVVVVVVVCARVPVESTVGVQFTDPDGF